MGKKIESDLDELLWAAAESDDPDVRADFERRFPDHRAELSTRRVMVDVFRQSRPDAPQDARLHFAPVPRTTTIGWKSRAVLVPAACLALAALALGAYQITRWVVAPASNPEPIGGATDQAQPRTAQPNTGPDLTEGVIPNTGQGGGAPDDRRGIGDRPPEPRATEVLVQLQGTMTLYGALNALAQQGKVSVEILPGVADAQIQLTTGGPSETFSLSVPDTIKLIEQSAPVKIMDNGPGNYMVFPVEKGAAVPPGGIEPHPAGGR